MLTPDSSIIVTALVIKYVQLPACPAALIYSMVTVVSVSRNCGAQEASSLIDSSNGSLTQKQSETSKRALN